MTENFDEYADLQGSGFVGSDPTAPEDEMFHSIYIAGQTRKNHINITEEAGKFQIRGVEYNLNEVNIVITHVKDILAKITHSGQRENIECFSFKKDNPPWYGTTKLGDGSPRVCPQTSAERAVNDFCNPCRAQIIVAGILCTDQGSPIIGEDKKPVFVFLRGKGTKYSNISNYLNDLFKEDLDPIFDPPTEQSLAFEKAVVNNKRFVTNVKKGQTQSQYGMKDVFVLSKGPSLPKEAVLNILKLSKQTLPNFNEKFDWSLRKASTSGYAPAQPEGVLPVEDKKEEATADFSTLNTETSTETKEEKPKAEGDKTWSFDKIQF
jgi:hypothetical protein